MSGRREALFLWRDDPGPSLSGAGHVTGVSSNATAILLDHAPTSSGVRREMASRGNRASKPLMQLESTLTCPHCAHQATETMPTDACQFFYDCKNCSARLKPR